LSLVQRINNSAVRLLARREHSYHELRQKLLLREFPRDAIDAVLEQLMQQGYQSDERFAQVYTNSRIRRGYGALKIQAELQERGVDKELIMAVVPDDAEFWQEQLALVWRKKFPPSSEKPTWNEQARQMRFLQSRGFAGEQIRKLWTFSYE